MTFYKIGIVNSYIAEIPDRPNYLGVVSDEMKSDIVASYPIVKSIRQQMRKAYEDRLGFLNKQKKIRKSLLDIFGQEKFEKEFIIKNNDRIAQMVLAPVHKIDFEEVREK